MYPRSLLRRLTASTPQANSASERSLQIRYGAFALLLLFVGGLHARLPRLPVVTPHLVAFDALPRALGGWRNDADTPIAPDLQELLPDARLLRRAYRDARDSKVELLLVSSRSPKDYHTPQYCLMAGNWQVTDSAPLQIGNEEATEMQIQSGTQQAIMLYWYQYPAGSTAWDRRAASWMSENAPAPLFVRIVAPMGSDPVAARQIARRFAQDACPSLQALVAAPSS